MAETHHFDVSKLFNVKDWVCVVTGGGTGIGLMVSLLLRQTEVILQLLVTKASKPAI